MSSVHTPPAPRSELIFWLVAAVAAAAVGFGIYCFYHQVDNGLIVTGLRNPGFSSGAWGLYICFDVYFVGVSFAGITVAAIARLFGVAVLEPVTRLAEFVTISSLLAGACVVMADLGRPLHGLLDLPRYARISSPFFGTFTLVVAGYLFSSCVFFFLSGRRDAAYMSQHGPRGLRWLWRLWASGYGDSEGERVRHHRVSFWLALTILPLLVTAHSTLGFTFGLQSGRPGWYSALQAPAFVVLAGVSGTGVVIVAAVALRRLYGLGDRIPDAALRWLGNFMCILALIYLYFMVVEELTASYAAPAADRHVAHEILTGAFSRTFWIAASSLFLAFLLPFILFLRKQVRPGWLVAAGILANVGAIFKRVLIVVPSQTHGALLPIEHGPYELTWVEYGIITGLFGFIALAVLLFSRVFPMVPSHAPPADDSAVHDHRRPWRRLATGATFALGLFLVIVGLGDSARLWRDELDPLIPLSPVLFALGIMILFISAIVYEIVPGEQRD